MHNRALVLGAAAFLIATPFGLDLNRLSAYPIAAEAAVSVSFDVFFNDLQVDLPLLRTDVRDFVADFTQGLPAGPFDGVLAANSLHFVAHRDGVLAAIRAALGPGGRFVLVEYDADHGNPWVPHPISFARWVRLAPLAGFTEPHMIHRVPSRFLNAIYGAAARSR